MTEDAILGDSFLRAAYVVYDQDNKNIYIANNEDCGSNLIAIGKGPNAVPSVVGECRHGLSTVSSSVSSTTTSSQSSSVSAAPVQSSNFTASGNYTWTSAGKTSTARATTSFIVTSTIRTTRTYTITSCAPTVTNCNIGKVTTEVYTSYTTHCPATTHTSQAMSSAMNTTRTGFPDITATYVLPVKYICHNGPSPCPNETRPPPPVVTVLPVVTQSTTVKVPGCALCSTSPRSASPSSVALRSSGAANATGGTFAPASTFTSMPASGAAPTSSRSTTATPCSTCSSALRPPTVTGGIGKGLNVPCAAALAVGAAAVGFW